MRVTLFLVQLTICAIPSNESSGITRHLLLTEKPIPSGVSEPLSPICTMKTLEWVAHAVRSLASHNHGCSCQYNSPKEPRIWADVDLRRPLSAVLHGVSSVSHSSHQQCSRNGLVFTGFNAELVKFTVCFHQCDHDRSIFNVHLQNFSTL